MLHEKQRLQAIKFRYTEHLLYLTINFMAFSYKDILIKDFSYFSNIVGNILRAFFRITYIDTICHFPRRAQP